ncbi:MAG: DUF2892 domain-containing protein [Gammaproteobacteria bacterium]|nr:DUF2892 domain-containing protein [Gammaproteobacteria bacterium]
MSKNLGGIDRTVRMIAGLAIAGAGLYYQSWWGAIGALLMATALMSWCPLYALLRVNTCRRPSSLP